MVKTITVFGATGSQGGTVSRALLALPAFKVRAVTRNPSSEKAIALKEEGAELVKADFNDPESLVPAMTGADGVFVVTNCFGLYHDTNEAMAKEVEMGTAAVDAAVKAGVKHYIFSSLPSIDEAIGKKNADFDSKAVVEKYLAASGLSYTAVHYSFFFENFIGLMPPRKGEDGSFSITLPVDGLLNGIDLKSAASIVASVFSNPEKYQGQVLRIAGDNISMGKYCSIMSQVTGKTISFNQVPSEVFAKFPFPSADELAIMFEFLSTQRDIYDMDLTRKINPDTKTFQQWAEENKNALLAVLV